MQPEDILQEDIRDVIEDVVNECSEEVQNIKEDFEQNILPSFNDVSQLSEIDANVLRMRAEYKFKTMQQYADRAHRYYDTRSRFFSLGDDQNTRERAIQRLNVARKIDSLGPNLAQVRQAIIAIGKKIVRHGWRIQDLDLYSLCMSNIQQAKESIGRLDFFLDEPAPTLDDPSLDLKIAELAPILVRTHVHLLRVERIPGEEDEGILEPNLEEISAAIKPVDQKLDRILAKIAANLPLWVKLTQDRTQRIVAATNDESEQEFDRHQRIFETARQQFAAIVGAIDAVYTLWLKTPSTGVREQADQALQQMRIEREKAWIALNQLEIQYKAKQVSHITVGIELNSSHFDVQADHAQEELDALYARLREASNILSDAHRFLSEHLGLFPRSIKRKLRGITEIMMAQVSSTQEALDKLQRKIHAENRKDELLDELEEEERQKCLANLLMENPDGVLNFIDEVLDKRALRDDLPAIGDAVDISLEHSKDSLDYSYGDVGFHGVRVDEGEIIRSYKIYNSEVDHKVTGLALLEQDSNGKVSNRSSKTLNKMQQTEVALQQALMFLSNYTPGSGDAIMRGKNPEMASKVYAAVLFLQETHPEFKPIKILCWVQNCDGPNTGLRLWGSNEQDFIHSQLDQEVLKHDGKRMAEQLKALTNVKKQGWEFRDNVMKQTCSQQAKMAQLEEHTLLEGQHLFSIRSA